MSHASYCKWPIQLPQDCLGTSTWLPLHHVKTLRLYVDLQTIVCHNLVPRFSLLPVERPWLGLVTCLPESGRLQTNDLGEGRISVRFVSTKRRRRDQWKLRIRPCLKGPVFYSSWTSQDKTSNAESFDSESVTSCRISGCLSDVAKGIKDSPVG